MCYSSNSCSVYIICRINTMTKWWCSPQSFTSFLHAMKVLLYIFLCSPSQQHTCIQVHIQYIQECNQNMYVWIVYKFLIYELFMKSHSADHYRLNVCWRNSCDKTMFRHLQNPLISQAQRNISSGFIDYSTELKWDIWKTMKLCLSYALPVIQNQKS